jgi:ATP-binding cassette, subfamily B (MDR/TAP), member 1
LNLTKLLTNTFEQGKSTVVQLMERFYDPTKGVVRLDGNDFKEVNVKWLRQHIALVQQEPKLFECSVRQNIAMGMRGATNDEIVAAAKLANAYEFIMGFPKQFDTQVGTLIYLETLCLRMTLYVSYNLSL